MITIRRKKERLRTAGEKSDIWFTISPREDAGVYAGGFGVLAAFNEIRLEPGGIYAHSVRDESEIVTYVYEGALAQEGSTGNSGVVHAGEFQRIAIGRGVRQKEMNASRTGWTRIFQITLCASRNGLDRPHEQKRFAAAQRHNLLCAIASPDGRDGSLRTLEDAIIYSSVLDSGYHIAHELLPGRSAWLHVIHGEAILQDVILTEGDGAGIAAEPAFSFTAQEKTELLLVDAGPAPEYLIGRILP